MADALPGWLTEAIKQGGLFATTVGGIAWGWLERRDRIKEREASSSALKGAQDLAVTATAAVTEFTGAITRLTDAVESVSDEVQRTREDSLRRRLGEQIDEAP